MESFKFVEDPFCAALVTHLSSPNGPDTSVFLNKTELGLLFLISLYLFNNIEFIF